MWPINSAQGFIWYWPCLLQSLCLNAHIISFCRMFVSLPKMANMPISSNLIFPFLRNHSFYRFEGNLTTYTNTYLLNGLFGLIRASIREASNRECNETPILKYETNAFTYRWWKWSIKCIQAVNNKLQSNCLLFIENCPEPIT